MKKWKLLVQNFPAHSKNKERETEFLMFLYKKKTSLWTQLVIIYIWMNKCKEVHLQDQYRQQSLSQTNHILSISRSYTLPQRTISRNVGCINPKRSKVAPVLLIKLHKFNHQVPTIVCIFYQGHQVPIRIFFNWEGRREDHTWISRNNCMHILSVSDTLWSEVSELAPARLCAPCLILWSEDSVFLAWECILRQ